MKVRIAHSHSTTNKKEHLRNFIKNILRLFSKKYATHYFACSELAGRWLFGDKTFNKGEVTVINNAIELEKYKFNEQTRDSLRAKYGLTNQFVIGHIGRFMSQKNHTFLIDIFYEVVKRQHNSKLLLIGDGPLYDEIVNKVHTLNLDDKVVFTGVKQNAYDYYNAMDVFVLPSLYEGLPVVGVEAQANGLPIVTSDTVTRDLNIAGGVDYLSLGETASFWAKTTRRASRSRAPSGCPNPPFFPSIPPTATALLPLRLRAINSNSACSVRRRPSPTPTSC